MGKPNVDAYEAVSFCNKQDWEWLDKRIENPYSTKYGYRTGETNVRMMLDYSIAKYFFVVWGPQRQTYQRMPRRISSKQPFNIQQHSSASRPT